MWCLLNISAHRSTNRDNECNMYAFYSYQPKENEISIYHWKPSKKQYIFAVTTIQLKKI